MYDKIQYKKKKEKKRKLEKKKKMEQVSLVESLQKNKENKHKQFPIHWTIIHLIFWKV